MRGETTFQSSQDMGGSDTVRKSLFFTVTIGELLAGPLVTSGDESLKKSWGRTGADERYRDELMKLSILACLG